MNLSGIVSYDTAPSPSSEKQAVEMPGLCIAPWKTPVNPASFHIPTATATVCKFLVQNTNNKYHHSTKRISRE